MTDAKDLEAAIKNRLETGFKNWNGGYDGVVSARIEY